MPGGSALPPPEHVCTVCGDRGNHFRVNCPVVRELGPSHLYGSKKSKKFQPRGGEFVVSADAGHGPAAASTSGAAERPPLPPQSSPRAEAASTSYDLEACTADFLAHEPPWRAAELDQFPMRASCLQQNVLVADLPPALQRRVWAYVARVVMPLNPELPRALALCAAHDPGALRLKELVETMEAYAVVEAFICTSARSGRPTEVIADCACGHGLAGILLAYRFPHAQVLCVDLFRRPAFDQVVAAIRHVGGKLAKWDAPLANLTFITGRLDDAAVRSRLGDRACVVGLHACTEANSSTIAMAQAAGALWAVMPCCMRTDQCAPAGCQLLRCPDDTRHALLCGSLAAQHHAALIASVDKRITNRHVVICGPAAPGEAAYLLPPRKPTAKPNFYPDHYNVHVLKQAE